MKNKIVTLCYVLLSIGIAVVFFSVAPLPIRKMEACAIPHSRVCYDSHRFSILPNSGAYKIVEGPDFNATLHEGSYLYIYFQAQPISVNFQIECRSVSISYRLAHPQLIIPDWDFRYVQQIEVKSSWIASESWSNISSLNVNHTVSEGDWLYRLKFENTDLQNNKTIYLSVIEYWTNVHLEDVVVQCYLLPYVFAGCGTAVFVVGVAVASFGIATKKFTTADLRGFPRGILNDIRYYVEIRDALVVLILTVIFLFLSIFVHTRLGIGEILVDEKTRETFVLYTGFPFEMTGMVTALTLRDWDILFRATMEVSEIGHGNTGLTYITYNSPVGGHLLILWDGLIWNFALYFTLSLILVLAIGCLRQRFGAKFADVMEKLSNF